MRQLDIPFMIQRQYKFILILAAIFGALLGAARMLNRSIDFTSGQTVTWWQIIENVQSGRGYKYCEDRYVPNCEFTNQETAVREPLPIYFYAFVGSITNNSPFVFQLVQIAIVLSIFYGVFLLGRELGGLSAGLIAACIWAFYLPAVRLESYITGDLPESLFVIFGFVKFAHILKHNRPGDWLQFGILFALASLSRSPALILVFGLGLGYIVFLIQMRRNSLPMPHGLFRKIIVSIAAFVLIMSPWIIRNYLVFGEPFFSTTLVGYNLYRHNSIVAQDGPPHYVTADEAYQLVFDLVARRPELMSNINEVQVSRIFQQEALRLVSEHPVNYLKLIVFRIPSLLFNIGVRELTIWDYINIVEQVFIFSAFIFGLRKNDWPIRLIGMSIFIYLFSYLLIESQLRYGIPVMSGVIAIGSVGLLSILPARMREQFP